MSQYLKAWRPRIVFGPPPRPIARRESHAETGVRLRLHQTDLQWCDGRTVLLMLDYENLSISAHRQGIAIPFDAVLAEIDARAAHVTAVAVFTSDKGDYETARRLSEEGWNVIRIDREAVTTSRGVELKANADLDLAFEVGSRLLQDHYDVLAIGTGDGDLGLAVARGARRTVPGITVVTLSVPGTTSHRLQVTAGNIDANVIIGNDAAGWGGRHSQEADHVRLPFACGNHGVPRLVLPGIDTGPESQRTTRETPRHRPPLVWARSR